MSRYPRVAVASFGLLRTDVRNNRSISRPRFTIAQNSASAPCLFTLARASATSRASADIVRLSSAISVGVSAGIAIGCASQAVGRSGHKYPMRALFDVLVDSRVRTGVSRSLWASAISAFPQQPNPSTADVRELAVRRSRPPFHEPTPSPLRVVSVSPRFGC